MSAPPSTTSPPMDAPKPAAPVTAGPVSSTSAPSTVVPSTSSPSAPAPASNATSNPAVTPAVVATPASFTATDTATKITIVDKTTSVDKSDHKSIPATEIHKTEITVTPSPAPSPGPQMPPTSIALPSPTTTTVLMAPPTPDHVTIAPVVTPVLAVGAMPLTPNTEVPPKSSTEAVPKAAPSPALMPVERIDTLVDLVPHTTPKSRRNSDSHVDPAKAKPSGLTLPPRAGFGRSASNGDLRSGLASPNIPSGAVEVLVAEVRLDRSLHDPHRPDPLSQLTLRAGKGRKPFAIHRHLLATKVPYFTDLFSREPTPGLNKLTFDELDEYGFAIFVRWLYGGELNGPKDFHSLTHYLALYCLALRFGVEDLQNESIDLVRRYYHQHSMTAPAYRLEYIYSFTVTPNHMRNFLIATAAYRCLCELPQSPGVYLSDSLKSVIAKQGDIGIDFAESLIKLSKNGLVDVRKGSDCIFHVHSDGKVCREMPLEPYENP